MIFRLQPCKAFGRAGSSQMRALCVLLLVLFGGGGVKAQNGDFAPRAKQAYLMDADSGAILYQHAGDELMFPASMSKLMTLAVVFRALKAGTLKPSDEFLVSEGAWRRGGAPSGTSAMMIPLNAKARLDELLQGIIIQSGNDACIVIGEGMAGSEDAFAKLMTEEGIKIGLKKSTFHNSTGLHHPEHQTTARDLAHLARYIIREHPEHMPLFSQKEYIYRKHRFINRNPLLFVNIGADGLKTGFTKEAGYGTLISASKPATRVWLVVLS